MGQKVNPIGFRVGVYRGWDSRWFTNKNYGDVVLQDVKIRKFVDENLDRAEVSRIEIERAGENIKVIVHSGRPGMVIGKKGQEIDSLRKQLASILSVTSVEVSVQEIRQPELDALLVARNIAEQLVRRASYKKAMKRAALSAMKSGARGVKICCSGRLGGAEIARIEWIRVGSSPLHTLRSDIDYGFAEAKTTYGMIGVKVWICKGEYQRKTKQAG
ncbi:TPA: 30S ribosomal protein S3 [Candidatus Dependentiae bacterium]|nr:MAG: 30S ribosomal protein S3 [candidate division TM6 bacterium GW2011_GWF2_36_131]KKQ03080.1 MAG: 30S ribosomal protein S3 [candidate division TM6 bacterium GW2011_GWE2_36_25]KKQ18423.1 MAG: 30S ribosomal protein S3 [candidate division TM6 bacterium GW2011_GWA2_36_9]HBR71161.1 30S ribosomal protein S3 [Candidatus Dependentiae bacterium]HCU00462.1 30S ribosomal protein S3 [Candidatus Dependentiae bacterium]